MTPTIELPFEGPAIHERILELAKAICGEFGEDERLAIAGIANGGIPFADLLAREISQILGREVPHGSLNITFQRDDIGHNPIPSIGPPTNLPFDVNQAVIILADDVLHSGRTVRAAINELFDMGRPDCVRLAVLLDRGERILPFQADYTGFVTEQTDAEKIRTHLDPEAPQKASFEPVLNRR